MILCTAQLDTACSVNTHIELSVLPFGGGKRDVAHQLSYVSRASEVKLIRFLEIGRWLYYNPHTHYTLTNAAAAAVQMTDGAVKHITGGVEPSTQAHANN